MIKANSHDQQDSKGQPLPDGVLQDNHPHPVGQAVDSGHGNPPAGHDLTHLLGVFNRHVAQVGQIPGLQVEFARTFDAGCAEQEFAFTRAFRNPDDGDVGMGNGPLRRPFCIGEEGRIRDIFRGRKLDAGQRFVEKGAGVVAHFDTRRGRDLTEIERDATPLLRCD